MSSKLSPRPSFYLHHNHFKVRSIHFLLPGVMFTPGAYFDCMFRRILQEYVKKEL